MIYSVSVANRETGAQSVVHIDGATGPDAEAKAIRDGWLVSGSEPDTMASILAEVRAIRESRLIRSPRTTIAESAFVLSFMVMGLGLLAFVVFEVLRGIYMGK